MHLRMSGVAVSLALVLAAGIIFFPQFPAGPTLPAGPGVPAGRPAHASGPLLVDDPIDGERVPEAIAGRCPIGVMIDNHPDARPQWGLSLAARVYEAITEGGITRYLAIFGPRDAGRVGPVRSTRTQFLDYAAELDTALAHVGGNADALNLIPVIRITTLDDFRYPGAYLRIFTPGLALEHTMFTSTQALRELVDQNQGAAVQIDHPAWKDGLPFDQGAAGYGVTIDFSSPVYRVSWIYRRTTNDYVRILAGSPDIDAATGEAVTAKSIAILVIGRTHGKTRINEDTWTFADIGSGGAWVVQDGTVTPGTWQKTSRTDRLRILDQAGNEIAFTRGAEWIEIIPPEVIPAFEQDSAGAGGGFTPAR